MCGLSHVIVASSSKTKLGFPGVPAGIFRYSLNVWIVSIHLCVYVHMCMCWLLEYCSASKRRGHGCKEHSVHCVQIGGSNNSIAAANSLMGELQVQKSQIMQSRPAGNCCPKAISFNISQACVGITHPLNKSSRQPASYLCPGSFTLKYKVTQIHTHTHTSAEGSRG